MKKMLIVIWMLMVGCLISSCEAGMEVIGIEIVTYPNKLVYVEGVDTELDFIGGTYRFLLLNGAEKTDPEIKQPERMEEALEGHRYTVETNIDFNNAGIYNVRLIPHENAKTVEFAVQVVSKEWLEEQLERAG